MLADSMVLEISVRVVGCWEETEEDKSYLRL